MVIVMKVLLYGVGINDSSYATRKSVDGVIKTCPFYVKWKSMLARCYSSKHQAKYPTYANCTVCDEWLTFSNFKKWMQTQDWKGKHLDKDLLKQGNKVYSPDFCLFVDANINTFINDQPLHRGDLPLGVYFDRDNLKFKSQCRNPFNGKNENLGRFECRHMAHIAWRKRKHELACQLADLQTNQKIKYALISRY